MKQSYAFVKTLGDNDMAEAINIHRDLVAKIQKLENDAIETLLSNHLRRKILPDEYKQVLISYCPALDKTTVSYEGTVLFTLTRSWDKCKYSIKIETV